METDGEYLYSSLDECKEAHDHLTSCDDDGYCNFCGEQGE
jgi:hypothetical protein